jgi:hypothetical protein
MPGEYDDSPYRFILVRHGNLLTPSLVFTPMVSALVTLGKRTVNVFAQSDGNPTVTDGDLASNVPVQE